MKISCERDALLRQLQTVSRVASTRSAIQALSGVQFAASSGGCELQATDMDVGLRVPLEAEIVREGTVVLPARLLLDVVRLLPAEQISLELRASEQDVELVSGNATFHIRTLRAEDFPPFPEPQTERRRVGSARGIRLDGAQGRELGLARRDPSGPDRDPRVGFGPRAPDGRDRLLPAERQGDDARGRAAVGVRGQRASPGSAGAGPRRRRTSRTRSSGSASARTRCCSSSGGSCCPRG